MPATIAAPAFSEPLIRKEDTMRYRPLGRTGRMVSALSFGCMRLLDNPPLNEKLISTAIDLGVNYFETTRGYLGGTCQHRVAPGLKKKTQGVIVSGKGGMGPDTTAYMFRKEIETQLDILGLTHFKFYQVGWFRWSYMPHLLKRGGVWDAVRRAQDEGLIQHVGFTGHDQPADVIRMIETGLFDSVTVPYNMVNRAYEPVIKRAAEIGVGVVAMCPVAGGMLTQTSKPLGEALGLALPTPAMSLRFVLANPGVSTACSGMNTMEMLDENVRTAKEFDPATANFEEMCAGLDRLRSSLGTQFCTTCNYCTGCPQKLPITHFMLVWQAAKAFGLTDWARKTMSDLPPERRPDQCTFCGACEPKCPNGIGIRQRIRELKEMGIV
jgi:predicted aldo/keto reductase-like oxidoreductase